MSHLGIVYALLGAAAVSYTHLDVYKRQYLQIGNTVLQVPASKKKALIDGGYDGKTVVMGIRPDVYKRQL